MATQQASPQPSTNHAKKQANRPTKPPDEQFWLRYSPHHEFPLSTLGSVLLHLLLYGAAAFLISTVFWPKDSTEPVKMDSLKVDSGGGGNPNGIITNRGPGVLPKERTEQANKSVVQPDQDQLTKNDLQLPHPQINTPKINVPNVRYVPDKGGEIVARFQAIRKDVQDFKTGPVAGAGKHGPGSGGGSGEGAGPGTGPGTGAGNNKLTPDERRLLRRTIHYRIDGSGDLYRRQLAGLGILVATPETKRDGTPVFRVYHDLNHVPPTGQVQDRSSLPNLAWEETQEGTVRLLAHALHIRTPSKFICFLPPQLEKKLLRKELEFKHVSDERQIKRTDFEVVPTPDGFDIVVQSQELYDK